MCYTGQSVRQYWKSRQPASPFAHCLSLLQIQSVLLLVSTEDGFLATRTLAWIVTRIRMRVSS